MSSHVIDDSASAILFQSTSSEEDVVSQNPIRCICLIQGFNPRPPKRTLCLLLSPCMFGIKDCFNPRPPKRTLCL